MRADSQAAGDTQEKEQQNRTNEDRVFGTSSAISHLLTEIEDIIV